jgi:hypothetical protein
MDETAYEYALRTARPEGLGDYQAYSRQHGNHEPPTPNMKKLILTLTAALLCAGAFGQGKLAFDNSNDYGSGVWTHLIYFATDTAKLLQADRTATANGTGSTYPIAGSGLYTGPGSTIAALSGSPTIIAALYAGTSASSLSLQTTTTIGDANGEGSVVPVLMTLNGFPAGTPVWFQIQVYDSRASSAAGAWAVAEYAGISQIFQATPQPAVYLPLDAALANSTWAPGTSPIVDMNAAYGTGHYGAIEVSAIPEPGAVALFGWGAALLMIYSRRR